MAPDSATRVADAGARLRLALSRTIRLTPAVAAEAASISERYRGGGRPPALADRASAVAYAAARMPATFAATARAMTEAAGRLPGFEPGTLLDVGAGTGASTWAASAVWPSLRTWTLVEREQAAIDLGRALLDDPAATWRRHDATSADLPPSDLVVAGYLLGELAAADRVRIVDRLWSATRGALVLVEPGSRAGFRRILAARSRAIAAGGQVVAPCPGNEPCPLSGSRTAWCHFLARLDRSPIQRRAKDATRSWEDEPFSYVVIARPELIADPRPRVVLGRPRHRPGVVELRVCDDGRMAPVVLSRRDGDRYREARKLAWGDAVPSSLDAVVPAPDLTDPTQG
jgi:ribosomal protein RSM22 (predicted rRNA methylase)